MVFIAFFDRYVKAARICLIYQALLEEIFAP
jgi:hypothetical protein